MPDITLCTNNTCPKAPTCYRANAKPDEFRQSYSKFQPTIIKDEVICLHYRKIEGMNPHAQTDEVLPPARQGRSA